MSRLTLYVDSAFCSPYAMSVFVTLLEKKLDFDLKTVDIDHDEHLQPAYRDLVPTGRIPALIHGDLVLNESSAIIEYLDEAFPAPQYPLALPADMRQRARARQVQAWIRSDLLALRAERSTNVVFCAPEPTPLSPAGQAASDRLMRTAEQLVDGENLFGPWCIADTDLALMLNRQVLNGDPVPQRLADYASRQWQRASVQQWLQKPR